MFQSDIRGVLDRDDLVAVRAAFRHAVAISHGKDVDQENLGRVVIKLYNMGVAEPQKLAALAILMLHSISFEQVPANQARRAGARAR